LVTERWNPQGKTEDDNIAWAIDAAVLTLDPFKLSLRYESLQMGPAFQPNVDLEAAMKSVSPKQKYAWNNAPASIQEWVGRADFLKAITNDWIDSKKRITGLIGFGGEGKSSLARRWVEDLLKDTTSPQPDGVFWWGFYDRPNIDEFFEVALNYLSGSNVDLARLYPSSSARVHFLAGMLHGGRYLFILDGLEGLQYQEGDQFGLLKSNDLREFLLFFAAPSHDSFCIVTSRVPLLDIMEYTTYQHRDVERLSAPDGRGLLKKLGVNGDDAKLDKVVVDCDGHALTLSLIGSHIADQYGGDISHIKDLPPPTADEPRYKRVHSILKHYDKHLSDEERAFLKIFSAFRIPVDKTAFDDVFRAKPQRLMNRILNRILGRKPEAIGVPIAALDIAALDDPAFEQMVRQLVDYRILRYEVRTGKYFTHPLIRSHYYDFLLAGDQSQALDVHRHLKEYYLSQAEDMPDNPTLYDLKPLIEALHHACGSGAYEEASNILSERIYQGDNFYLIQTLGAYETNLMILQEFFSEGDTSQDPLFSSPRDKSWILGEIGFSLMNMGRLDRAEQFLVRANFIDLNVIKNWSNASILYQNLSDLYASLGALDRSAEASRQALELSIRSGNKDIEVRSIAFLAFVEHLQGYLAAASKDFKKAETLQRETDPILRYLNSFRGMQYLYLYSYRGIHHADHLFQVGNAVYARKVTKLNLEICKVQHWLNCVSRCHRLLGDLDANDGDHDGARTHYNEALKIAREITNLRLLIESLLARGRWGAKHMKNASEAFSDLDEALNYATTSGFRIFEADIRVALAWAHLVAGNKENAKAEALRAKQMSDDMGYYWGKKDSDEVLAEIEKVQQD
jgi:tetratricopeptide (TPR) repeat protein